MEITKLTYSRSDLDALTEDQLSTFLSLGLFLNEVNWLQKLLYVSSHKREGSEADRDSRLSLSIMLSKLLAAKLNQGWNRINNQLKDTLEALPPNDKITSLHAELVKKLAKDSLIHSIRTNHSSHYPTKLSLRELPNISQEEVAIYMTDNLGDVLSLVSDLSSVAEMLKGCTDSRTISEANLGEFLEEVYTAAQIYCQFIAEVLAVFVSDVIKAEGEIKTIKYDKPLKADMINLGYFMDHE